MLGHFDHETVSNWRFKLRSHFSGMSTPAMVAALLIVLVAPGLWAQTTATIQGTITDPDGAPLPGVAVRVFGEQGTRAVVTDNRGFYLIPVLPPGTYRLTASLEGFATREVEDFTLYLNQTLTLDLSLELGAFEETIEVSSNLVLLQTQAPTTGALVTPEEIEVLPVNGRNYIDLVQLVPGVSVNRQADEGDDDRTPIMGERAGNQVFLVDGMPNRSEFGGGPSTIFNQDTIREFEVLTDGFKAEFGHGSGGIINVVTKSGTNELKGMGFVYYRDDNLSSSNSLDPENEVPYLERFDYGFTLGGALLKDKLFFFGSAERIQEDRQLNFSFPPATPDFIIDREEGYNDFTKDRNNRFFLKLTEQLGSRHRLTQQASYTDRDLSDFLPLSAGESLPSARNSFTDERTMVALRDESLLGDQNNPWVLEAYAQYRDEPSWQGPAHPEAGSSTAFFIFSATNTYAIAGDLGTVSFGNANSQSTVNQKFTSLGGSLAKYVGNHTLKGGIDYLKTKVDGQEPRTLYNQLFATVDNFEEYGPLYAGQVIPLVLGGLTDEAAQLNLNNDYTGLFIQDDWQIHPNLTLNVGLRWDYDAEFEDDNNFGPRLGFAWSLDEKTVIRGSWGLYYDRYRMGLVRDIPQFGGADLRLIQSLAYPQLFNNLTTIAPIIVGLCINPELTEAEIAAGNVPCPLGPYPHWGYDRLNGVVAAGYDPLPFGTVVTIDNVQELTGLTPDEYLAAVTAAAPQLIPGFEWFWGPLGMLSSTLLSPQNVPSTVDPAFETPYTKAYHVGVQRLLGRDWVVQLDYHHRDYENLLGTRYTNLAFESRLAGFPTFEGEDGVGVLGFGPWYEGSYDAVSLGLTKRFSHGFSLSAYYTYTDAVDNLLNSQLGGDVSVAGGGVLPSDSFVGVPPVVVDPETGETNENGGFTAWNGAWVPQAGVFYNGPDLDKGRSGLAIEHTLVLYGLVELPWKLQLSGIFRWQSGFPFSRAALVLTDIDGSGTYNDRDFNYERNSFEAPDYTSLDLRLARPFSLGGDTFLTVLFEVFNITNEQNPAAVENTPDRPIPFGQPLQVLPGREGQIGVKIEF
jgi:hypothetical protein